MGSDSNTAGVAMGSFYEFFAGGGMARAGLGPGWTCLFANDVDGRKGLTYQDNWGTGGELHIGDVGRLTTSQLPGQADLIWGSFPCQDLSLAGVGAGLNGERSGTFYPFWRVVKALIAEGRGPRIVALENVCGTLTSREGRDFEAICNAFAGAGYRYGALVINARLFVPQSRPRLFVIGVSADVQVDPALLSSGPIEPFHTPDKFGVPSSAIYRFCWASNPAPFIEVNTAAVATPLSLPGTPDVLPAISVSVPSAFSRQIWLVEPVE